MKYTQKSFTVTGTKAYVDNWDKVFGPKAGENPGPVRKVHESDFPDIVELRAKGDAAWASGHKGLADSYHHAATEFAEKYGVGIRRCEQCGAYMSAALLDEHKTTHV